MTDKLEDMEVEEEEEMVDVYTLTDDETGESKEYECIGEVEMDGNTYYAMIPYNEESDEYVILRLEKEEGDEVSLVTIDDDDEFEKVAEYFDNNLFDEEIDYDN